MGFGGHRGKGKFPIGSRERIRPVSSLSVERKKHSELPPNGKCLHCQ